MAMFPEPVIQAMHYAGTTVTCLPVQMNSCQVDNGQWRAAIFFVLPESWENRLITQTFCDGVLFPIGLEADLLEQDTATLISLEIDIKFPAQSIPGEILFIPGHLESHLDTVKLLCEQQGIDLFIGDKYCNLLHQQTIPLQREHRLVFGDLLKEATSRDALIRFRGEYDPQAAFDALVGRTGKWMPEPPKSTDQL